MNFKNTALNVFLGFAALLIFYGCWLLFKPFLPSLTVALTLTVVTKVPRDWIFSRLPRNIAAASIMLLVAMILILPGIALGHQVLHESVYIISKYKQSFNAENWNTFLESHSGVRWTWEWINKQFDLPALIQEVITQLSQYVGPIVVRSFHSLVQLATEMVFFFFFLRDHESILRALRLALPLSESESTLLFTRVSSVIHASVVGRLLSACLQGFLGGVAFWILGVHPAAFWGAVMAFLSVFPVVGSFVVWIPVAMFLFFQGEWVRALVLVAWGILVINPVDNLLYPLLIGNRMGLHPLLLFVAFLGGIMVFGPSGLIIGPIIIALALVLTEISKARCLTESHGVDSNI